MNAPAFLVNDIFDGNELTSKRQSVETIVSDLDGEIACSGVGIALPDRNGTVTVQSSSDGSSWITEAVVSFAAHRVILGLFEPAVYPHWRLVFDAPTELSVVKLGLVHRMPQDNYSGVNPPRLNQEDVQQPQSYVSGAFLGRQAFGRVGSATYTQEHAKMADTRLYMDLVEQLREGRGAFYAWRPDKYPNDVIYGILSGEISPENTGVRDYMGLSISLTGVVNTTPPTYHKPTVTPPMVES